MVVFFLQRAYFCRLLVCKWSNSFSGLAEWERTVVNIFLQQNKTCCNLHSLSGEFSCSLRSSLRYLNDNDMMFQFQKDTMMIKRIMGQAQKYPYMLRLSVSIHGTSVNVPKPMKLQRAQCAASWREMFCLSDGGSARRQVLASKEARRSASRQVLDHQLSFFEIVLS